eukprot:2761299-Pyramimonas_sp.AAC.2
MSVSSPTTTADLLFGAWIAQGCAPAGGCQVAVRESHRSSCQISGWVVPSTPRRSRMCGKWRSGKSSSVRLAHLLVKYMHGRNCCSACNICRAVAFEGGRSTCHACSQPT